MVSSNKGIYHGGFHKITMDKKQESYFIRRLIVDGLKRALSIEPLTCIKCGWPYGGTGKYICLCGKK